jgi:hypothetical protein
MNVPLQGVNVTALNIEHTAKSKELLRRGFCLKETWFHKFVTQKGR